MIPPCLMTSMMNYFQNNWKPITVGALIVLVAKKALEELTSENTNKETLIKRATSIALQIPGSSFLVDGQLNKLAADLEKSEFAHRTCLYSEFPSEPISPAKIFSHISEMKGHTKLNEIEGKISGTLYHGGEELTRLLTAAESAAIWTNTLHPGINPWVCQCEAEIIEWCREIFGNVTGVCGTMSSGGTSSIFLACKAYRDRAIEKGIRSPEIVMPESAHAAFDKAAHVLGMKVVKVPVDANTSKANIAKMREAITKNTAMIVGSAPSFAHGVVDDIEQLSDIAIFEGNRYFGEAIPLHVDACLGGFVLGFITNAPKFDFRVPGVTSLSVDTHKYGNATKGSSVILYRNKELLHYQYFLHMDSSIGVYATPTYEGSRSGAPIAAAWAAMLYFGRHGYATLAENIIRTREEVEEKIRKLDDLEVIGKPQLMVIAFKTKGDPLKILPIVSNMAKKGWELNVLPGPSVHFCITNKHALEKTFSDRFVSELMESIQEAKNHPDQKLVGGASLYGKSLQLPAELMAKGAEIYFDVLYQCKPK